MTTNEHDAIFDLAQGNPGALRILLQVSQTGDLPRVLSNLRDAKAYGPRIWLLYKDINGEDLPAFMQSSEDIMKLLEQYPSVKTEWDYYESSIPTAP